MVRRQTRRRNIRGGASITRSNRRTNFTQDLQRYRTLLKEINEEIESLNQQIYDLSYKALLAIREEEDLEGNRPTNQQRSRRNLIKKRPAIKQIEDDIEELDKILRSKEESQRMYENLIQNLQGEIARLNTGAPIVNRSRVRRRPSWRN